MNKSIDLELCFIVHTRKYTDSKNIVTLLTQSQGLVSGVLRVSKRKKMILNPPVFCPIQVSWIGQSALKTITFWESTHTQFELLGSSLFCAIYMNEIINRLVHEEESHNDIFSIYSFALKQLSSSGGDRFEQEKILRVFELSMLRELGFELNLYVDVEGKKIVTNSLKYYSYDAQLGFSEIANDDSLLHVQKRPSSSHIGRHQAPHIFSGDDLFNITQGEWNEASLKAAKKLTRQALAPLLGSKPIKARELFS